MSSKIHLQQLTKVIKLFPYFNEVIVMRKYAGLFALVAKHIDVTDLQLSIILEVGKLNASLPDKNVC